MDRGEELRVEAAPYCCSSCDGGEVNARSMARRSQKRKTRSLSTSSARSLSTSSAGSSTEHSRRNQSLHGPSPVTTFGPKACMLQNPHTVILP
ncbi:NAD kinase-like [Notothenia coriiceps]|uniref:NAD kinase-like n=1 Tax=Notothenia coriiceps TaxID=8208 RepID=A0A6I9Q042_9TELE|nr:PREDICTED: NAD kinase-like [Notothenia coriiceps]